MAQIEASKGGLLEAADAEAQEEPKCIFARARDNMSGQNRAELEFMLDNPKKYTVSRIFRAMNQIGYRMSRSSVDHHLRNECACAR